MVQPRLLADVLPDCDAQLAQIHEHAPFYFHFGHFMALFASAESSFHEFFHATCGLSEELAKALVGGEQIGKLVSLCNRLVQAGAWDEQRKSEFQILIDQMNAIRDFRDTLVHRGVERIAGGITSSNAGTAKSLASIEILRFNLDHMKDASADLTRIILELFSLRVPEMWGRASLRGSALRKAINQPWRYKRIAPEKPNHRPVKVVNDVFTSGLHLFRNDGISHGRTPP